MGTTEERFLADVYRTNFGRVYGFARNRLDESDAADVTSEVFHAAAVNVRDGRSADITTTWLMAVTRNKVHDHWRKAYRRKAKAHLVEGRREDRMEWPEDWHEDPRRPVVIAALDALSARHRSLLVLHHVDGMTIAELAEASGDTHAAIESALARARRRFRQVYQEISDA